LIFIFSFDLSTPPLSLCGILRAERGGRRIGGIGEFVFSERSEEKTALRLEFSLRKLFLNSQGAKPFFMKEKIEFEHDIEYAILWRIIDKYVHARDFSSLAAWCSSAPTRFPLSVLLKNPHTSTQDIPTIHI